MVIRVQAREQPNLPGTPRANPNAFNIGDAVAVVGEGIADLGASLAVVRKQEQEREREIALRQARVEAVKRLTAERALADEDPEYDGLNERFEGRVGAIREELAGRFADDETREEFGSLYDELAVKYQAGVIEREVKLRSATSRSRLEADLGDLLIEYGAAPDETVRGGIADQAAGAVARAQAAGLISEDQAEEALEKFGRQAMQAEILRQMREDPEGLRAALEGGEFEIGPQERQKLIGEAEQAAAAAAKSAAGVTAEEARAQAIEALEARPDRLIDDIDRGLYDALAPAERARYRVSALNAIEDAAERERKRAETAEAERVKAVGQQVDNAETALMEGRRVAELGALMRAAQGTEHEARLDALVRNRAAVGGFSRLAPAARAAALKAERDRPVDARTEADQARLGLMRELDANLRESEERDILTHVAERGLADIGEIDFADPATMAARRATALALAEEYDVAPRFFSEAEQAQIATTLRTASVEDKLGLITTMVDGFGPQATDALGELGFEDPLFAHAGTLVAESGRPETARAILAGQQALKEGTIKAPSTQPRGQAMAELRVHEAIPLELEAARTQIRRAADAHFAATAPHLLGSDDKEAIIEAYARSLDAVAGAVTVNGEKHGGFQEVTWSDPPQMALLPPSLKIEDVKNVFSAATILDLAGASRTKQEPSFAGDPLDPAQISELVPRYTGGGLYLLGVMVRGEFQALADEAEPGGRALFDLEALAGRVTPRAGILGRADEALRGIMRGPADNSGGSR